MIQKGIKMALAAAALTGQLDAANLDNEQISSLQKDVRILSENILGKKDARALTTKELSRLGLNISSNKIVSYDFDNSDASDVIETDDGYVYIVDGKKIDTSDLEHHADSGMIKTDAVELSDAQGHAIDFLKKEFPEYANDAEMIHLLSGGEEERNKNIKDEWYYDIVKELIGKSGNIAGITIEDFEKGAPKTYQIIYDNGTYPMFKDLNVIINLQKANQKGREANQKGREDIKKMYKLIKFLKENS